MCDILSLTQRKPTKKSEEFGLGLIWETEFGLLEKTKIRSTGIPKLGLQEKTEIRYTGIPKLGLQEYRNSVYGNTEIRFTRTPIFGLEVNRN